MKRLNCVVIGTFEPSPYHKENLDEGDRKDSTTQNALCVV